MYPAGFEPTISTGERPQIHALVRAVTGFGAYSPYCNILKTNGLDPNEIHVVCHLSVQTQAFRITIYFGLRFMRCSGPIQTKITIALQMLMLTANKKFNPNSFSTLIRTVRRRIESRTQCHVVQIVHR